MSLKTFFNRIFNGIRELFEGLVPEMKQAIGIGVTVVENIKKVIDSPVADILTAIIPGDLDDMIKTQLRAHIPKILIELRLAKDCADETDPEKIVACALRTIQQLEGDYRSAFLHDLSILIAQVAADGKLDWKDGVYILQWYYDHQHKNA